MWSRRNPAFLLVAALAMAAASVADDAPRPAVDPAIRVDVKKLDGVIRRTPTGEWLMTVEYQIRLKASKGATIPAEPLDLLIRMTDNGRALIDADGQPVVFVVPLNAPKKNKPGKQEFEGETVISLGNDYGGDVEGLRLFPLVAPAESDAAAVRAGPNAGTVPMQPQAGVVTRGAATISPTHSAAMMAETRVYPTSGNTLLGLRPGFVYESDEDEDEDERGFEVEFEEPIRNVTLWLGPVGVGLGR
ncbi:MAG: hypothetical protein SF069_09355 [Phycisphaerae bacterium]|nr:hypothetical protein [Phycisphaerae bacterium]